MAKFDIVEIAPGVHSFADEEKCSFYVVEGTDRAAVIDTGITKDFQILPVIRQVTSKPLCLVVTHVHLDHMYHMDEFDTVYMCHEELKLPQEFLEKMACGKDLDYQGTIDVRTDSVIELGDNQLEICQLAGHTPGSIVVLDKGHDMLFTGDAIGSGCGVWMQVASAIPLESYQTQLMNCLRWLVERGGTMSFWGGHNFQQGESRCMPGFNPLNLGLLADMAELVRKICSEEITGKQTEMGAHAATEPVLYASYGRAEILYVKSNVHKKK